MRQLALLVVLAPSLALAGPYAAHGLLATDPSLVGWATGVTGLARGPMDIANPSLGLASQGVAANALGVRDGTTVSLGDGGTITVSFASPIANGVGADFAVFENGFSTGTSSVFAELGYVAVSSDGVNFFTMPSVSLTQTATQVGGFGSIDPTDVHNLAGQYAGTEGTPFDLSDLLGTSPLLNVNAITSVRITDVVGDLDPLYARKDSLGNTINDPYSTPFASGGFDLDAVGVIHAAPVPEPSALAALAFGGLALVRRRRR